MAPAARPSAGAHEPRPFCFKEFVLFRGCVCSPTWGRVGRIRSPAAEKPRGPACAGKLSLLVEAAALQDAIFITVSEARDN